MLSRSTILFLFLVFSIVASTASAGNIYPLPGEPIAGAALQLRQKDYQAASLLASKAPPSGAREFILGICASKKQDAAAIEYFARAAEAFPLLADYSLYEKARALHRVSRGGEAVSPLQKLLKEYPESPLTRVSQLLLADTLYDSGDFKNGYTAYQKFIEKFPAGDDSLAATYKSALCLEKLGDTSGAVASLRTFRLKYPTSSFAAQAEKDLQRLASSGNTVAPYTTEEQLRYASTLFDLRKFDQAAQVIQNLPLEAQPAGITDKYELKAAQALFKARKYKEAEAELAALLKKRTNISISDEANYWLAKVLDKTGREDLAVEAFTKLSESTANADLASRALFEAALIRKGQRKGAEAIALQQKILATHPDTPLRQSVSWEIAWGSYQAGDFKNAAEQLRILTEIDSSREKALYWYGRSLSSAGDIPGAQQAFSTLVEEFPFGFYAQSSGNEIGLKQETHLPINKTFCDLLPVPAGYERVKALITFGLFEEARKELALSRKKSPAKNGSVLGVARLYLEMDDFNGAYNLLKKERPAQLINADTIYQWGLCFPLAYREHVAKVATENRVPESLVYAVMRAESSFSPSALSPAGAVGLMQLMPATAASMASGSKKDFNAAVLTNPEINIGYGVKHLRDLLSQYKGNQVLAIAAYNAGSGNVNRWRKAFGKMSKDEFIESIPFAETREYVKKVLSSAAIYSRLYKLDPASVAVPRPEENVPDNGVSRSPSEEGAHLAPLVTAAGNSQPTPRLN